METHKIKMLRDTPFDNANAVISISEFRDRYSRFVHKDNSDEFIINYVREGYKSDRHDIDFGKWFEVVEVPVNNFRAGDWVWHEGLQKAFYAVTASQVNSMTKEWQPNHVSFAAANKYVEIYKRKATDAEIEQFDLVKFGYSDILIGQYKCYYYKNVWKEFIGVHKSVSGYIVKSKEQKLNEVSILKQGTSYIEDSWECNLNGLKVGCMAIPHDEVIGIARILKLI